MVNDTRIIKKVDCLGNTFYVSSVTYKGDIVWSFLSSEALKFADEKQAQRFIVINSTENPQQLEDVIISKN